MGDGMNKDDDLTWLARNVHKFDDVANYVTLSRDVYFHQYRPAGCVSHSKEQWLSRRAELQNKPRFADHPDAQCFFQHEGGMWFKNVESSDMGVDGIGWRNNHPSLRIDGGWVRTGKGEILGDWRDTLEKRPECCGGQEAVRLVTESTNRIRVAVGLEPLPLPADSGASWFERGELPPVGTECEIRHSGWLGGKFEAVTVKAVTREYVIVMYSIKTEQHFYLNDVSFRPIRTERDELVDLISRGSLKLHNIDTIAEEILAAGFTKK
jgi:hypothetical protein